MKFTLRVKLFITSFVLVIPLSFALWSLLGLYQGQLDFTQQEIRGLEATTPVARTLFLLQSSHGESTQSADLASVVEGFTPIAQKYRIHLTIEKAELQRAGVAWNEVNTLESRLKFYLSGNPDTYEKVFGLTRGLIAYLGDTSNLILDPDINSYYLISVLMIDLPDLITVIDKIQTTLREWPANPLPADYFNAYTLVGAYEKKIGDLAVSLDRSLKNDPGPYGSIPGYVDRMEAQKQPLLAALNMLDNVLKGQARSGQWNLALSKPVFLDAQKILQKTDSLGREFLALMLQARISSIQRALVFAFALCAVLVAGGLFLVLFMVGRIRGKVFLQMAAFERVSQGDLTIRLSPKGGDELAKSAASFNRFMDTFQGNFRNLSTLSKVLGSSAVKVQSSSEFLGKGSQTQAATVEETSTTMETFSDTLEGIRIHMSKQPEATEETF